MKVCPKCGKRVTITTNPPYIPEHLLGMAHTVTVGCLDCGYAYTMSVARDTTPGLDYHVYAVEMAYERFYYGLSEAE